MSALIATLGAFADRQVRRALIEKLQAHARQRHSRIDAIAMNMDFPRYLEEFYRLEQIKPLAEQLAKQSFWWVGVANQEPVMLYDSKRRLLWEAAPDANTRLSLNDGKQRAAQLTIAALEGWHLPTKNQLVAFATDQGNPLRRGANARLLGQCYWLCAGGYIDLDSGTSASVNQGGSQYMIACNASFIATSLETVIEMAIQRGVALTPGDPKDAKNLLASFKGSPDLPTLYSPIDWLSARLPRLEPAQFTDPNKGLWEFWGQDAEDLRAAGVRARNPADDLKDWNIAIDFGTSSTVVAYDDNGQHKLLRIGVQDFWAREEPGDYENPTILEFIDLAALLDAWRADAYRPGVLWDQVRCSHEALHNLRHNESNPRVVASVLAKLKQWALREGVDAPLRITDQAKGREHELQPLTLRMPVKGQPLTVSADDPFDPIELYAWFLGLTINWRGRGLFPRYYMTFPVGYPREIKDRILFLAALHQAFADQPPERIQVLLAGNASRSPIVARLFGLASGAGVEDQRRTEGAGAADANPAVSTDLGKTPAAPAADDPLQLNVQQQLQALFGSRVPELQPHPPLPIDADAVYRPTAKTGVALGLLRLCPGGVVKVVNRAATASGGEAPFAFHVGRERLGRFQVGLHQGSPYGEWHELGAPRDRVFNLYYSQLPRAQTGDLRIGEPGLYKRRLDLHGELSGHKVFARATGPDRVEIRTAVSSAAIGDGQAENTRTLTLE